MGYYPVKIRSVDRKFSSYIRRGGKCEICGRSDIKLECAHYFSRSKESVRFDERNCHCLCYNCHKKSHENKSYYKDWLLEKYGQKWLDKLEIDSNAYCKKDDELIKIFLKSLEKNA